MDADKKSLQTRLHTATRVQHTDLNRTILARLPLCLPPHTSSPEAYYLGLLLFSHIYTTLEHTTHEILQNTATSSRTRSILSPLQTPRLTRSTALQHDLQRLLARLRIPAHPTLVLRQAQTLTAPVAAAITAKPHLALAYAWTMYLALFNGGRHIQRALISQTPTHPHFWTGDDNQTTSSVSDTALASDYLTFWHFDSPVPNAEDIKSAFKHRLDTSSQLLSATEQDEVADEGARCFELCARMIAWLDGYMLSMTPRGHPEHQHQHQQQKQEQQQQQQQQQKQEEQTRQQQDRTAYTTPSHALSLLSRWWAQSRIQTIRPNPST